jgi:tetratricopeptide (TPR) repeat protein
MKDVHAGRDIIFGNKQLLERVYDQFAARLGFWGQIAVGAFLLVCLCLWYWQHIEQLPFIDVVVSWFSEQSLPQADPDRFAIVVANLEGDAGHHLEEQIVEALRGFEQEEGAQDVEILRFDRQISNDGTESSERAGYEQARRYLGRSGAQVLIWGSVLSNGKDNAYRLYWTTSDIGRRAKTLYQAEDFKLPPIFWNELVDVLQLLVISESAHYFNLRGQFIADKLRPFVAQVGQLFHGSQGQAGWNASTRGEVGRVLAWALEVLGEQAGNDQALKESISVSRDVLEITSREQTPLDWAMTQNALGAALTVLGQHESGIQHLTEAVAAYRAALEEYNSERVPLQRMMIQNNLGVALMDLGVREPGTKHLEEAVLAYRAALQESTRERAPLQWAMIQLNLGAALGTLGGREAGTKDLEEAVAADRAALREYTRERTPLDWATIQLNMGAALTDLGAREPGTKHLEEAVAADRAALQEYTRERTPLDWATIQLDLGVALRRLGEREPGTQHLEEAVAADRAALQEYTLERTPVEWAITQNNLGLALAMLGGREAAGTKHLEEAIATYHAVLQESTRERAPLQWAITQYNLGAAVRLLGEREPRTEHLEYAVACYRAALEVLSREQDPERWAEAQNGLGDTLRDLAIRTKDASLLCAALQGHLNAWEVSAGAAPYNASIAAVGARQDVAMLRERFVPAAFQGCLAQNAQALEQMRLQ